VFVDFNNIIKPLFLVDDGGAVTGLLHRHFLLGLRVGVKVALHLFPSKKRGGSCPPPHWS
jgi:hypothetical protein